MALLGAWVWGAALATAIVALYTAPVFAALGLHPLALDVANGAITIDALGAMEIAGKRFTAREIAHLRDVADLVHWSRILCAVLIVGLAVMVWRRTPGIRPAILIASAGHLLACLAIAGAHAVSGHIPVSDLLHGLFFAPGSYIFPPETLTATLYTHADITRGAIFVAGATLAALGLAWLVVGRAKVRN